MVAPETGRSSPSSTIPEIVAEDIVIGAALGTAGVSVERGSPPPSACLGGRGRSAFSARSEADGSGPESSLSTRGQNTMARIIRSPAVRAIRTFFMIVKPPSVVTAADANDSPSAGTVPDRATLASALVSVAGAAPAAARD